MSKKPIDTDVIFTLAMPDSRFIVTANGGEMEMREVMDDGTEIFSEKVYSGQSRLVTIFKRIKDRMP